MTYNNRLAEIDLANPTYLMFSRNDELPDVVPMTVGASVFVGTGSNCKVQLVDESVQQLHCMFALGDNNVLKVQDWNTGATYLNGEIISEETEMKSGDMINIGCYCFTAVLDAGFHEGIAVELLGGGGELLNSGRKTASENLNTLVDQDSSKQAGADEADQYEADQNDADQNNIVSGFNIGDDFADVADKKAKQAADAGFKYDINADLNEESSVDGNGFDSLPTDLGFAFNGNTDDDYDDDTSMLMMEVEQLRFELADRDSQIATLQNERESAADTSMVDDSDTLKLVTRLEDLLVELDTSDGRIRNMEDLLRLSEEATAAERDERSQMEIWVTEIENRIGQRQTESQAEVDGLTKQLEAARGNASVLETQLHSVSILDADNDKQNEAVTALSSQVEELRLSLQKANQENLELRDRPVSSEEDEDLQGKLKQAQDELAKLRLEASRQRAETARRHAELENLRADLERQLSQSTHDGYSGDSRIRAMREHLNEIHEQEKAAKAEEKAIGLGGRIANLLSKLH